MPKVTFEEVEAEIVSQEPAPQNAVVVKETQTLAVVGEDPSKGLFGEWGREDMRLPRINLVNKTGDLSNLFTPGVWVVNKEHELNKLDPKNKNASIPLRVIPLRLGAEYQESLPYDPNVRGRVFKTAEEVRAHGGVIAYGKGEGKFAKVAHIELLVEAPEDLGEDASSVFFYTLGDKKYARVIYTAGGTAYSETAPVLYNDVKMGFLAKTGFGGGFYTLGSRLKTGDKGSWWLPVLKTAGLVPAETLEEVRAILS